MLVEALKPVNVFVNDPNAKGLGLEQVAPPTGKSPFAIPGWNGTGGLFNPGTTDFEAGELYVVLTRAYAAWSDFFGADFGWQPGFAQLPVVPRAGRDFNAYYDRKGLKFFFNTDQATSQTIKYKDPSKLPGKAPASKLSSESHSFSRVFSGAFYDLLVGIYEQLRKEDSTLSPDAALAQACSDAGHLLGQGLILAPKRDALFKTIAVLMLTANAQNLGGKYQTVLKNVFVKRRILKVSEIKSVVATAVTGHIKTGVLAGTASAMIRTPAAIDPTRLHLGDDLPSGLRRQRGVPKQALQFVGALKRRDASQVLYFTATREVELKGKELGVARGARVLVLDGLAIHIDRNGTVISSHFQSSNRAHQKRIRDHVANLVARDRIYAAPRGETVDPASLIETKKPYYVAYDEQGNKQIRRAFIACG